LRGQFIRGWDHGKGIDNNRVFTSFQNDVIKQHAHYIDGVWQYGNGLNQNNYGSYYGGGHSITGNHGVSGNLLDDSYLNSTQLYGDTETRPKNVALLPCIKAY
jgi:hypothetical protein